MEDIEIIKNLVDKLDNVMALEINPHSESGKQMLNQLSNMETLFIVSPLSDKYSDRLEITTNSQLKEPVNSDNLDPLLNPSEQKINDAGLTTREKQVLTLLASGLSNKVIALKLGISYCTVKVHVKNILSKLKLHSRLQAAVWAVELSRQDKLNEIDNCEEKNV